VSRPHQRRRRLFASALFLAACGPPAPGDVARDGVESLDPFPSQVSVVLTAARAAMGLDHTILGVVADAAVESPWGAFRTLIYSTADGAVRMEQTTPFLAVVDASPGHTRRVGGAARRCALHGLGSAHDWASAGGEAVPPGRVSARMMRCSSTRSTASR
jgi:hypothetical protein